METNVVKKYDVPQEEHQHRHGVLHRCLTELIEDYVKNHPGTDLTKLPFNHVYKWSHQQKESITHKW